MICSNCIFNYKHNVIKRFVSFVYLNRDHKNDKKDLKYRIEKNVDIKLYIQINTHIPHNISIK